MRISNASLFAEFSYILKYTVFSFIMSNQGMQMCRFHPSSPICFSGRPAMIFSLIHICLGEKHLISDNSGPQDLVINYIRKLDILLLTSNMTNKLRSIPVYLISCYKSSILHLCN